MVDNGLSDSFGQASSSSPVLKLRPHHGARILPKFFDVSSWAFFSIDLSPLCRKQIQGCYVTGCMVFTCLQSQENKSLREVRISSLIRSTWRKILVRLSVDQTKELRSELDDLLYYESDSLIEVQEALETIFNSANALTPGADEGLWLLSPTLQRYARLRRMAMPLHHMEVGSSSEHHILADCSLVDLLLDMPELGIAASRSLKERLGEIQRTIDHSVTDTETVKQLHQLQRMITNALLHAGFSVTPLNRKEILQTYLVPDTVRRDHAAVISERNRLLRHLQLRKQNPCIVRSHNTLNGDVELPQRFRDGTVLVTEKEMSFEAFQAQSTMGNAVSRKLQRLYIPGVSRPRLCAVSIPVEGLVDLRSIFFDEHGALNTDIVGDIDLSSRHSFITFSNDGSDRADLRWQVPLRRHGKNQTVRTRRLVEQLLAKHGCVNKAKEQIHDLGMLMGGTEDQSLHHDIPRQTTSFLPYDPEEYRGTNDQQQHSIAQAPGRAEVAASGWEFDRAAYNDAMMSPWAPSSLLLGMGDDFKVLVGVQRNQVDRKDCKVGWCRIVDGRHDETFRIVRESEHMITIEGNPGIAFTGDFQHAGVRNFDEGTAEDSLMQRLFEGILEATVPRSEDSTERVIDLMCNFPGLNRICRFHCSTEPVDGPLVIPRNAVGFVDCKKNPPSYMSPKRGPPLKKKRGEPTPAAIV